MITFLALLTVAAQLMVVAILVGALVRRRAPHRFAAIVEALGRDALRIAGLVALVAAAGSLYMSEVRHFQPCVLCWYQRIAMYPLVLVLGVAAFIDDRRVGRYVLPLATLGALVSAYHYQLERFPDQEAIACTTSVPCTTIWFQEFGYITLPMMAGSAFVLIALLVTIGARHGQGITDEA